jgi:aspartate/glutamate racemase
MVNVDFDEIEKLQHAGKWDDTAVILSQAAIDIPILHIADGAGIL